MKRIFTKLSRRVKQVWVRSLPIYHEKGTLAVIRQLYEWVILGKRETHIPPPAKPRLPSNTENWADPAVQGRASLRSKPGVSIIIPVWNARASLEPCLTTLYQVTTAVPFEVIVIDDGSTDDTAIWLAASAQQYRDLYAAYFAEHQGFARAVNVGLQIARGQYLIILQPETRVTAGWLERLIATAESDPRIGMVSVVPDRFTCVLIKRLMINLVGGLDEGYLRGDFADADFCLRVRLAGYTLAVAPNAFVHHQMSQPKTPDWEQHRSLIRFYNKVSQLSTARLPYTQPATTPAISVIVRTKDRPASLQAALTSLANQTFKGFEVILVNDGGVDVADLVSQFQPCLPITYIRHEKPIGRTPALNVGVRAAQGEYLSYLDDDDIVYPLHFEILHQAMMQSQQAFVYSDFHYVLLTEHGAQGEILARLPVLPWEYNPAKLLIRNYLPLHTWLHKRALVDQIGYFDEALDSLEDWEFLLRIAAQGALQHVPAVTCEYRIYQNSANSIVHQRRAALSSLKTIYQRYPSDNPSVQAERALELQGSAALMEEVEQLHQKIQQQPDQQARWQTEIIYRCIPFKGYEL